MRTITKHSAIHARYSGKYKTVDKLKIQTIHKLNTTQKTKQHQMQQNKLSWFSHLIWHLARKQDGLILQCSWAHEVQFANKQVEMLQDDNASR